MAEFMLRTGMTPSDMYPAGKGRTFLILGPATTLSLPAGYGAPAVSRTFQCRMLVETEALDTRGLAESWKVTRITRSGPC